MFGGPLLNDLVKSDVLTVSEYASRLGSALREVGGATLEGEVQNPKLTPRGMLFFHLTDGESNLSCKVFPRDVAGMEHKPKSGDLVRVQVDRPDFYAANGSLNLIVSKLTLAGEGELLRLRAELVGRLTREGLCDPARRRPLPTFPRAVGVISGHGSDGMSDVVKALTDRWPAVLIVTHASAVQGKAAPRQLINALATFQEQMQVDVIVMARGGGSVQDLACFDDEALCRALFACDIPVVCAIGHTDNSPVCNHVTWSAYTPSRSAEMVVPSEAEIRHAIARARELVRAVPGRLELADERISAAASRLQAGAMLDARRHDVLERSTELTDAIRGFFQTHITGLANARASLSAAPRHAAHELAAQQATLASASSTLARTGERLQSLATRTAELGDHIRVSINRQLTSHSHNYSRAITRLISEALAGIDRADKRHRALLATESDRLEAGARTRVADANQTVAHLAALIAARDFRRRGWLLASNDGNPVRSAADLHTGDRLELQLHDGSAEAVVEQVQRHEGATHHD
jgi:exodeoxyribonuclease VII large subunit